MKEIMVAGAALNQIPLAWDHNMANIREAIAQAKAQGVELLCLPELCISGYGCEDMFLHPHVPQRAMACLLDLLPHTQGITVAVGLPVLWHGHRYNCAALLIDGKIEGLTAKQFLANDGVYYEPRWFSPWDAERMDGIKIGGVIYPFGDITYKWKDLLLGIELCEDAWHGEQRPAKRHIVRGASIMLCLNASHFQLGKLQQRQQLVVEGCNYLDTVYIYANMLGNESGRLIFDGDIIIGQSGQILLQHPRLSLQQVELASMKVIMDNPMTTTAPSADDEPDQDTFEEIRKAAVLALRDYLAKSRSKCFVLSLSGGADSSTCAVLVSEMVREGIRQLGGEGFLASIHRADLGQVLTGNAEADAKTLCGHLLHTAYQATRNSGPATQASAEALAAEIGSTHHHWQVDSVVELAKETIGQALGTTLNWEEHDIALQNIQSRSRSPFIWLLCNVLGGLLISTANRSEAATGYATMDGDTSGSITPLAGLSKHMVQQWLHWAQHHLGYASLQLVNSMPPTAELRPPAQGQTDEADLMPYPILARIEQLFALERRSPDEIVLKLEVEGIEGHLAKHYVDRFLSLWHRNQWKRERYAPSFHFDTFSMDSRSWFRFPILSGTQSTSQ